MIYMKKHSAHHMHSILWDHCLYLLLSLGGKGAWISGDAIKPSSWAGASGCPVPPFPTTMESAKDQGDVNSTTRHSHYGASDNLKIQGGPVNFLNSTLCDQ